MKEATAIDNYIQTFSPDVQTILKQVHSTIREAIPEAEETINYGIPTFKVSGKNVVHFAAFTNHIGFYPTPDGIIKFEKELSQYKGAKGSVRFPLGQPMPLDLIKKISLFRLKQVEEKGKKK